MTPKLSIVRPSDTCEGTGKGAQIIQLPVTPKLHAIEGGKTSSANNIHVEVRTNTHTALKRPNIGIGHHNAQRHWEKEDTSGRKADSIIAGTYVEAIDNHPILAAETIISRVDGVRVIVQLTHNAYAELLKNRLSVPTDIPEDAY